MVEANPHPDPDVLSAFALGRLADADIGVVGDHLGECATCRAAVAVASDSFLELLCSGTGSLGPDTTASRPLDDADVEPDADVPPELVNNERYRLVRRIGRGGMGTVYLAEHRVMRQRRAIKVMKPSLVSDARAIARFIREIEVVAKLHHPNVVQAFDAERLGSTCLLVMEYVEGETLVQMVERQGPLPIGRVCEFARQTAVGLEYSHAQGLVHRDLKPANLMVIDGDRVKILDFGLAKLAADVPGATDVTGEGASMGTPAYMAPEQAIDAGNADCRADIYSLGCTLFFMLTGRPPFTKANHFQHSLAHVLEPPPDVSVDRPDVPIELAALVRRMLAKSPDQRPQTAGEVARSLAAIAYGEPIAPESVAALPASPPRNRIGRIGAGVLVLCVGLLLLWAGGIIRVRTPAGTVVLEGLPADAEVFIDGRKIEVRLAGDKEGTSIEAVAGKHELKIAKGGFVAFTKEITLISGRSETVRVHLEPLIAVETKPAAPVGDGWTPLFNGKDLADWQTWEPRPEWAVEEGLLVGRFRKSIPRGQQPILFSQRGDFEDFDLRVEAMFGDGVGSGIRFRCPFGPGDPYSYEFMLNATADEPDQTGSIHDCMRVDRRLHLPNEWFTLEASVHGDQIETWVNGVAAAAAGRLGRFKKGYIALLPPWAGTTVKFRRIDVRPLPPSHPAFAGKPGQFVPLFEGKNFGGFRAPARDGVHWVVEDGLLKARGPVRHLFSSYGYFEDFHLRAEVLLQKGGRCGIGFRAHDDHPFPVQAYYLQVSDATTPGRRTGTIAGILEAAELVDRPLEWCTLELIARGNHFVVKANGKTLLDDTDPHWRFRMGHIVLENGTPTSEVAFRKVEIMELPPTK